MGTDEPTPTNYPGMIPDYRSSRSDVGSSTTDRYHLDSGYGGSKSLATSARSVDQLDHGQSGQSIHGDVHELHTFSDDGYPDASVRSDPSPHYQYPTMDVLGDNAQRNAVTFELACSHQGCGAIAKNQSEHKKHMLRHEKPFKCDVPGCSKIGGFSTNNDLDRHKKSVHKIMPKNSTDRSFRCAALNCPKKEKIWPRLDNFRQHCFRIHPGEDCDELVRKSEMDPGHSKQASNFDDSSNHDAGDVRLGPEISGMTNFINPWITFDSPLSTLPVPTYTFYGLGKQDKHTSISNPTSPDGPEIGSDLARYSPSLQQPDTRHLLQVPDMNSPRKRIRPRSPSSKPFSDFEPPNNVDPFKSPSERSTKGKYLASAKKAEEVSEKLASEITKCINLSRDSPGAIQATIKNRLLLTFNPDLSRKRSAQMAALQDDNDEGKRTRIECDQCPTTTARQCEMKYQHPLQPYSKFGSKNDWKRHENTQHYQIEAWRCHEPPRTSAIGQCASIFYRREQFQTHLRDTHQRDEVYIREQCISRRIGRNGQGAFWCGLCVEVVELRSKGLDAWEERFSHIDDRHYKAGQKIEEWVPLESNVPKGRLNRGGLEGTDCHDDGNDCAHSESSGSSEEDADDRSSLGNTPKVQSSTPQKRITASAAEESAGCPNREKGPRSSGRQLEVWYCVMKRLIRLAGSYSAAADGEGRTSLAQATPASNAPIDGVEAVKVTMSRLTLRYEFLGSRPPARKHVRRTLAWKHVRRGSDTGHSISVASCVLLQGPIQDKRDNVVLGTRLYSALVHVRDMQLGELGCTYQSRRTVDAAPSTSSGNWRIPTLHGPDILDRLIDVAMNVCGEL
ncbi:MAG: hypothetical protein Q9211_002322 [Gyalolechia sp. 1 TL-2023]